MSQGTNPKNGLTPSCSQRKNANFDASTNPSDPITFGSLGSLSSPSASISSNVFNTSNPSPSSAPFCPLNILVTNDDGFDALGIQVLFKALRAQGHHVLMVAPETNKSAISCALTLSDHLIVKSQGVNIWSVAGTPCDCVIGSFYSDLAARSDGFLDESGKVSTPPFDLVISGINDGGNIGTDITYSGTCAAARQASLYNCPAIALSMTFTDDKGEPYWRYSKLDKQKFFEAMMKSVFDNWEELVSLAFLEQGRSFININAYSYEHWKGLRRCALHSKREYFDRVELEPLPDGNLRSRLIGGDVKSSLQTDSDVRACLEGYLSVTKVCTEPVSLAW